MKVFISWSGERSRDAAIALRDWLPNVLQTVDPFVSARDIMAGARWQEEIAVQLDETDFGLICVTRMNRSAEWLNFEAGALAKSLERSRVVPLAIGLGPTDIKNPLGQFQVKRPDKQGISDMVVSMNEASDSQVSDARLREAIDVWWEKLGERLEEIETKKYEDEDADERQSEPVRSERDLLEEILGSVRALAARAVGTEHAYGITNRTAEEIVDSLGDALKADGISDWRIQAPGAGRIDWRVFVPEGNRDDLMAARRTAGLLAEEGIAITFRPHDGGDWTDKSGQPV